MKISFLFFITVIATIVYSCLAIAAMPTNNNAFIAIVNPMSSEGQPILNMLRDKRTEKIADIIYTIGDIHGEKVIQVFTGIGKVNAADANLLKTAENIHNKNYQVIFGKIATSDNYPTTCVFQFKAISNFS